MFRDHVFFRVESQKIPPDHETLQLEIEETLHGMPARIFQHENEHMNGYVFTDLVSKFKLEIAEKKRRKMIKEFTRGGVIR